jgi:RNA polymerase sigma factor (sigma-70 family)
MTMTDPDIDIADAPTADLVTRARTGNQLAWAELVDRLSPLLRSIARRHRLNHSDAADVVQATWLKLIENFHHIREPRAVPSWLATTCQREALRITRVSARCPPQDATMLLAQRSDQDSGPDPADLVLQEEAVTMVRAALDDLPAMQRQLLAALAEPTECSRYTQVATTLKLPVGSIGPTRQRALRRLRANPKLRGIRETSKASIEKFHVSSVQMSRYGETGLR